MGASNILALFWFQHTIGRGELVILSNVVLGWPRSMYSHSLSHSDTYIHNEGSTSSGLPDHPPRSQIMHPDQPARSANMHGCSCHLLMRGQRCHARGACVVHARQAKQAGTREGRALLPSKHASLGVPKQCCPHPCACPQIKEITQRGTTAAAAAKQQAKRNRLRLTRLPTSSSPCFGSRSLKALPGGASL